MTVSKLPLTHPDRAEVKPEKTRDHHVRERDRLDDPEEHARQTQPAGHSEPARCSAGLKDAPEEHLVADADRQPKSGRVPTTRLLRRGATSLSQNS